MSADPMFTEKTARFNSQQHGPDSIHSWLTAGACALSTFFALAPLRSSGILYVIIMKEFSVSREEAVWTIMLLGGARVLSGEFLSRLYLQCAYPYPTA